MDHWCSSTLASMHTQIHREHVVGAQMEGSELTHQHCLPPLGLSACVVISLASSDQEL